MAKTGVAGDVADNGSDGGGSCVRAVAEIISRRSVFWVSLMVDRAVSLLESFEVKSSADEFAVAMYGWVECFPSDAFSVPRSR